MESGSGSERALSGLPAVQEAEPEVQGERIPGQVLAQEAGESIPVQGERLPGQVLVQEAGELIPVPVVGARFQVRFVSAEREAEEERVRTEQQEPH